MVNQHQKYCVNEAMQREYCDSSCPLYPCFLGVLGEATYKLLRRIPIENIGVDGESRVVLRLLRHVDKKDATTLLNAIKKSLKKDRESEREEIKSILG
jgi:hypothetical protein